MHLSNTYGRLNIPATHAVSNFSSGGGRRREEGKRKGDEGGGGGGEEGGEGGGEEGGEGSVTVIAVRIQSALGTTIQVSFRDAKQGHLLQPNSPSWLRVHASELHPSQHQRSFPEWPS